MTPDPTLERAARRRELLDRLLRDPDDAYAKSALTDLMAESHAPPRLAGGVGLLAVVAIGCAVLSLLALLGGMDVTAALLAVAGLYAVLMVRRRARRATSFGA